MSDRLFIGTAGWSVPHAEAGRVPEQGTHLIRYAACLNATEINSSFYRPHRADTYARWATSVPDGFRFSVKLPKTITHEARLEADGPAFDDFAGAVRSLGDKLGVILVQLPPSLPFFPATFDRFVHRLRKKFACPIAFEPRHPSWFSQGADAALVAAGVARVGADPPPVPDADTPGGSRRLAYLRLHGSPRMYYSDYGPDALAAITRKVGALRSTADEVWCIFDNTAAFHAFGNALALTEATRPTKS